MADAQRFRRYDERGMVRIADGELSVAVTAHTNIELTLRQPVPVTRPLGGTAEVTTVRLFADDPSAALAVLAADPVRAD